MTQSILIIALHLDIWYAYHLFWTEVICISFARTVLCLDLLTS